MQVRLYPSDQFNAIRCGTPSTVLKRLKELDAQIANLKKERGRGLAQCGEVSADHGKVVHIGASSFHVLDKDELLGKGAATSTIDNQNGGLLAELLDSNRWPTIWKPQFRDSHYRFVASKLAA